MGIRKRIFGSFKLSLVVMICVTSILTPAQSLNSRPDNAVNTSQRLELGMGDRRSSVMNGKQVTWYKQAAQDGLNFKYFEMWLTSYWQEQWVGRQAGLRQMANDGYTPVLVYYYFGEPINKEMVESGLVAWYADCERLHHLVDIDRDVMIVIEPEFNKKPYSGTPVYNWSGWNSAVVGAIQRIKGNSPHIKVGLCPGDFGEYNLQTSMSESAHYSDFVAFQEMRGSTHRQAYSRTYRDVSTPALRFSDYLHRTFNLPVMLAYLAVSSYGASEDWTQVQDDTITSVVNHLDDFENRGVFSIIYMAYYDDPQHDYSYFGEAERHFGLRDCTGVPKPGWYKWQEASLRLIAKNR